MGLTAVELPDLTTGNPLRPGLRVDVNEVIQRATGPVNMVLVR